MRQERVWVLGDDRPGNVAQCVGVAEALGEPFRLLDVRYTIHSNWHNLLRASSRFGIARHSRKALTPPWPALVIAAGRRTAPLARWLKKRHGARLVQIMDPGWPGRGEFDLIATPRHDQMPLAANIIETIGSCHRASPALLAREGAVWAERLAALPRPWLVLSVGGATKDSAFPLTQARQLAHQTLALAQTLGGSLLVTTSRRSGGALTRFLEGELAGAAHLYFHPWSAAGDNPYLGFIACADALVVTGDSMNMCSEACANGGPVFIFSPPGLVNDKHARLHQELFEMGYARPLGGDPSPWTHPPLNAALEVAKAVRARGLLTG